MQFMPYVWYFQATDTFSGPFMDIMEILAKKLGFWYAVEHFNNQLSLLLY